MRQLLTNRTVGSKGLAWALYHFHFQIQGISDGRTGGKSSRNLETGTAEECYLFLEYVQELSYPGLLTQEGYAHSGRCCGIVEMLLLQE